MTIQISIFIVPDIGSLFLHGLGPATTHQVIVTRNCGGGQPQFCLLLRPAAFVQDLTPPELTSRHPPPPLRDYWWIRISDNLVVGKPHDCILRAALLTPTSWRQRGPLVCLLGRFTRFRVCFYARGGFQAAANIAGFVFLAHPLLHGFPWFVPESVANIHL